MCYDTRTHRNSKGLTPLALAREKGEHFKGAVAVLEVRFVCCAVSYSGQGACVIVRQGRMAVNG